MKSGNPNAEGSEYGKYLQILFQHSDEKAVITQKVIEYTGPDKTTSVLDIGAGPGDITIPISKLVKDTSAVEVNPDLCDILRKNNITVYQGKWEDFSSDRKFDLVLASHFLYYVADWGANVRKMHSYLAENGQLCLVLLSSKGSFFDLFQRFYPPEQVRAFRKPEDFAEELRGNYSFKIKHAESRFVFPLDTAIDVFSFFSMVGLNKKSELVKYLQEKTDDKGIVTLPEHHDFIIISK